MLLEQGWIRAVLLTGFRGKSTADTLGIHRWETE